MSEYVYNSNVDHVDIYIQCQSLTRNNKNKNAVYNFSSSLQSGQNHAPVGSVAIPTQL